MRPLLLLAALSLTAHAQTASVTIPTSLSATPLDGRILFLLSNNAEAEPRMQIDDTPRSQIVFGVTRRSPHRRHPRHHRRQSRRLPYRPPL